MGLAREQRLLRYSEAFKQQIVSEIEKGEKTPTQAKKMYNLGGDTVNRWIKRYGKNHLLAKRVIIQTLDEVSMLKKAEERVRELEKALSDAHMRLMVSEAKNEIYEEKYGILKKKKTGNLLKDALEEASLIEKVQRKKA